MSEQIINIGAAPNDGTGDPLRTAFQKIKSMFSELYSLAISTDQKDALEGTEGTPSAANKYVTHEDTRLADSRTPSGAAGGDLTGTFPSPTLILGAVTNAKLADMAQNTIKGRFSVGLGDPEDLTAAQVRSILDVYSTSETPSTFTDLTDAPSSYVGHSLKLIRVKADETGIEFTPTGVVYTDEDARDCIAAALSSAGDLTFTHDDGADTITGTVNVNAITNTKLADVPENTIKGRYSSGTGDPEDLSPYSARQILNVYNRAEVDAIIASAFINTFAALIDVPDYSTHGGKYIKIKADGSGIEYDTPAVGGSYDNEAAQDAIGSILDAGSVGDVNFNYNDVTPVISGVIKNQAITNAKLANVATQTIKGRTTTGTGSPEDLTPAQARAVIGSVQSYADLASLPVTGETQVVYITEDDNSTYRWNGSAYVSTGGGGGGSVGSVFGRTGSVVAVAGDYTTDLVTEATNLYFTEARVRASVLTGISFVSGGAISATDSVLQAFGKIQYELNGHASTISTLTTNVAARWAYDGNTVGSEKFIGTLDNYELPVRVNNTEVARFISDGMEIVGAGSEIVYTGNLILTETATEIARFTSDGIEIAGTSEIQFTTNLIFTESGTTIMTVNSAAVGIGVSPSGRFTVRGAGTTTGELLRLENSAGTARDLLLDNGTRTITGATSFKSGNTAAGNGVNVVSPTSTKAIQMYFTTSGDDPRITFTTGDWLIGHDSTVAQAGTIQSSRTLTLKTLTNYGLVYQSGTIDTSGIAHAFVAPFTGASSGTYLSIAGGLTYAATSTTTYKVLSITPSYNLTGAGPNTVYGIDYNPTLTAMTGTTHYGLLVRAGVVGIGLGSTMPTDTLQVRSAGAALSFSAQNSSGNYVLRVDNPEVRFGTGSGVLISAANGSTVSVSGSGLKFQSGNYGFFFTSDPSLSGNTQVTFGTAGLTAKLINSTAFKYFAINPSVGNANAGETTNALHTILQVSPTLNFSAGQTTLAGIEYAPTLTAVVGLTHYGILIRPTEALNGFGLDATMPTAIIDVAASTTARASLRIRTGAAPTTPNDGDVWQDGTDIKIRIGGVTKTFTLV